MTLDIKQELEKLLEEYHLTIEVEYELKNQLLIEETKKQDFENNIWLGTDFSKMLKSNNEQTRKAYVSNQMATQFIDRTGNLANDIRFIQGYLKYLSKKINIILDIGVSDEGYDAAQKFVIENSELNEKFPEIVKNISKTLGEEE